MVPSNFLAGAAKEPAFIFFFDLARFRGVNRIVNCRLLTLLPLDAKLVLVKLVRLHEFLSFVEHDCVAEHILAQVIKV